MPLPKSPPGGSDDWFALFPMNADGNGTDLAGGELEVALNPEAIDCVGFLDVPGPAVMVEVTMSSGKAFYRKEASLAAARKFARDWCVKHGLLAGTP